MTSVGVMASSSVAVVNCTDVLAEPFNNLAAWTLNGTPVINLTGRTGYGAGISQAPTNYLAYNIPAGSQSATLTLGFAWKNNSSISPGAVMAQLRSDAGATLHNQLYINASSKLAFTLNATDIATSTNTLAIATWYYLEVQVTLADAPNGLVTFRLNGTAISTQSTFDTKNAGTKTVYDQIRITGPIAGFTNQFDDLYLSTGTGCGFKGDQSYPASIDVLLEPFNNLSAWANTSNATLITGRSGTGNAMRLNGSGPNFFIPDIQRSITVAVGVGYRASNLPGTNRPILQVIDPTGGSVMATLQLNSNGSIQMFASTTAALGSASSAGTIAINTWYYIEFRITISNTVGAAEARVNGSTVCGPVSATDTNQGFVEWTPPGYVHLFGTAGATHDFDDFYLSTGAASFKGDITIP